MCIFACWKHRKLALSFVHEYLLSMIHCYWWSEENASMSASIIYYSETSLSHPPLSRQTRFLPCISLEWISYHIFCLQKSPASPLTLATQSLSMLLCKVISLACLLPDNLAIAKTLIAYIVNRIAIELLLELLLKLAFIIGDWCCWFFFKLPIWENG